MRCQLAQCHGDVDLRDLTCMSVCWSSTAPVRSILCLKVGLSGLRQSTGSAVTSETRYLDANKPQDEWRVVLPRVNDVEYEVDHRIDHFFITLRDERRPNSELLVAPVADPSDTTVNP